MQAPGGFRDDRELVRDEIDACSREPTSERLPDARVPLQRLQTLVEIPWMLREAGEQAFLRSHEVERVQQVPLCDLRVAAVINQQPIAGGDFLNDEFDTIPARNHIARRKLHPHQRRGLKGISAGFLCCGKTNLNPVAIDRANDAEPESGFGSGNPSLAG